MNEIINAIKCSNCREILDSPIILPCSDSICRKHISDSEQLIKCFKCGSEHEVLKDGFPSFKALAKIIATNIDKLDFGEVHRNAKNSCQSLEELFKEVVNVLKDPFHLTHEYISDLKNTVQLKGEEFKVMIDQKMKQMFDTLDMYEQECKGYLSSDEYITKSKTFNADLKSIQFQLNEWIATLNKIKVDEETWKTIIKESNEKHSKLNADFISLKDSLFLNKLVEIKNPVDFFKHIDIEETTKYRRVFDSKIINFEQEIELENLLKSKNLNSQKWKLLYCASRDGFKAAKFHGNCDRIVNTLTLVKAASGNIFGGYTHAEWNSYQTSYYNDPKAFIFSLLNKDNKPLIFQQKENCYNNGSIYCSSYYGPTFGNGYDFCIADCSDSNEKSYSELGNTYMHQDYLKGTDKAKSILAGSFNFRVDDIEVYQKQ